MQKVKETRLRIERLELVEERRLEAAKAWFAYRARHYAPGEFLPGQIDIWLMKEVESIVQRPSEISVDESIFEELFKSKLATFIDGWRSERLFKLKRRVQIDGVWWADPVDRLKLAVCVFSCAKEEEMHWRVRNQDETPWYPCMWFPQYLHHPCNAICPEPWDQDDLPTADLPFSECKALEVPREYRACRRMVWTDEGLMFDEKASHAVINILDACGLNYKTCLVEQLDKVDPRLVCLKCSFGNTIDGERSFSILTWRTAVCPTQSRLYSC